MDNWVLTGPKALTKQLQSESAVSPTQVKVKVTHVLVSNYDALSYSGVVKVSYPKTIGRFAVGVITEVGKECYGLEKGARVCIEATRACKSCLSCKSGNPSECENVLVAGKDFDGFLRDFVVCEYNEVAQIPDSVDDLHALCIEHVALAENIFDKLNLSDGSKVAVIGGGFFGTVLAQIALYHKLIPIVIDNNAQNIERLKRSGIYYAFAADDDLLTNISEATSGMLCDAAIFSSCCKISPALATRVLARKKDMVICGFSNVSSSLDVQTLFEKELRLFAATSGYDYTEVAINMLVHGAIDLSQFDVRVLTEYDPASLLTERLENFSPENTLNVIKLIL